MPQLIRYLTHPQVLIEALKDVRAWSLNHQGNDRVSALAAQLGTFSGTRRIVSSSETKAIKTATPIALTLGVEIGIRPQMHENDGNSMNRTTSERACP